MKRGARTYANIIVEGMASTDDDRMRAMELGLAPHLSPAQSSPGFFDSSQDVSQVPGLDTALSEKTPNRQQKSTPLIVQTASTGRSAASATPARLLGSNELPVDPVTPLEKAKKEAKGSKSSAKRSITPSEASTSIETPSGRPKRNAAKRRDYSAPWNADGTEIKSSSSKSKSSSKKEEVIIIDEDDDEGDQGARQEDNATVVDAKARQSIDSDEEMAEDDEDDDEVISSGKRGSKGKGKTKKNRLADESDEEASEEIASSRSKTTAKGANAKNRRSNARLQESDEEETPELKAKKAAVEPTGPQKVDLAVVIETPASKGRGASKGAGRRGVATKGKQQMPAEEEEEKVEDDDDEEEAEEEEPPVHRNKSKEKATVLNDASGAVNARLDSKKADSVTSSSSSTPKAKTGFISVAKQFWGKREYSIETDVYLEC